MKEIDDDGIVLLPVSSPFFIGSDNFGELVEFCLAMWRVLAERTRVDDQVQVFVESVEQVEEEVMSILLIVIVELRGRRDDVLQQPRECSCRMRAASKLACV